MLLICFGCNLAARCFFRSSLFQFLECVGSGSEFRIKLERGFVGCTRGGGILFLFENVSDTPLSSRVSRLVFPGRKLEIATKRREAAIEILTGDSGELADLI